MHQFVQVFYIYLQMLKIDCTVLDTQSVQIIVLLITVDKNVQNSNRYQTTDENYIKFMHDISPLGLHQVK